MDLNSEDREVNRNEQVSFHGNTLYFANISRLVISILLMFFFFDLLCVIYRKWLMVVGAAFGNGHGGLEEAYFVQCIIIYLGSWFL